MQSFVLVLHHHNSDGKPRTTGVVSQAVGRIICVQTVKDSNNSSYKYKIGYDGMQIIGFRIQSQDELHLVVFGSPFYLVFLGPFRRVFTRVLHVPGTSVG